MVFSQNRGSLSALRSQMGLRECIRMEPASVDLDPQEFFQSDIAKVYLAAKVVEQGKLAWLFGRFEPHRVEAEALGKPVCEGAVKIPVVIKQTHTTCTLSGFHNQLRGARIEPVVALLNQRVHHAIAEFPGVFFAELELNFEAALMRQANDM